MCVCVGGGGGGGARVTFAPPPPLSRVLKGGGEREMSGETEKRVRSVTGSDSVQSRFTTPQLFVPTMNSSPVSCWREVSLTGQ